MARTKKPSAHSEFSQSLKALKQQPELPFHILIHGSSHFLRLKALDRIKRLAQQKNMIVETHDAADMAPETLRDQYEQTGLFGDEQLIVLLGLEKAPKLLAQARLAAQKPPLQTRLVMVFAQDKVPANLQKALPEPTHQVVCLTPGLRDMPAFLKDLARSYQVPLDDAITSMLLDSLGQDLFKIDNELRNLALLFADRDQPASAAEVQDALGFMRDDHAFRLDEYLLAGQRAKALNLIDDLIRRGESPLAILGILAHHCRKALDIHGQGGQAPAAMRMPRFVVQKFVQALQRRGSEPYRQALRSCQEADMILKTSQLPEQIALTPIVLRLTMSSEPTKRRYEPVSRSPG